MKYFTKYNFLEDDASFISASTGEIDVRKGKKFELSRDLFLSQKDKVGPIDRIQNIEKLVRKTINVAGLIQFMVIIGSIPAILDLLFK